SPRAPRKAAAPKAKRASAAKPRAAASAKTAARKPRRKTNRFLAPPPPLPLEARDDRGVFALLLVPFVLLIAAVSASQLYTPPDTARSQFALLPEPVTVAASKAMPLDGPPDAAQQFALLSDPAPVAASKAPPLDAAPRPRLAAPAGAPDTVRAAERTEPAD